MGPGIAESQQVRNAGKTRKCPYLICKAFIHLDAEMHSGRDFTTNTNPSVRLLTAMLKLKTKAKLFSPQIQMDANDWCIR